MPEQNPNAIDAERVNPGTLWQRRDSGGNLGKEMVQPGKTSRDLLMRTYLRDVNMVVDIVGFRDYLREFKIEDDDALIDDFLAGMASVGGLSRLQYTEISTGLMVEPSPSMFDRMRGKKGKNGDKSNT